MGADSKIEWCHHTHNPWWGCHKIDPECKNCYAAAFAKRTGKATWGTDEPRRFFGPKHWLEPIKWNASATKRGVRERVFCASMADVFEDRRDLDVWRWWLFGLIRATPQLDWMLLTKRPENMNSLAPDGWRDGWPVNVWAGTTAGSQGTADDNLPELMRVPASVRFLSAEPLLEQTILRSEWLNGLSLVITGAESGGKARPMQEDWVRSLRDQCTEAGVAFFYKQKLDERGQKVGLPLLDGRQWAEMPQGQS